MNVSEVDLNCMLVGIINDLEKDRMAEYFNNANESHRVEIVEAYMNEQLKKTMTLMVDLRSNRKTGFYSAVYELLK